ncbi:MFS transporter (plasmid) [Streptomyces sp. HUAS TT11]|uniref:MFS transporter n=1 Tax=Streptomyces sp. HUAS TT11 TaxID=3447508 RepID=UPI003F657802
MTTTSSTASGGNKPGGSRSRSLLARLLSPYALPSRDGRIFALTVAVFSFGRGLYLTSGTVFFVKGVGLSATQVGTGLSIAGLIGFLMTVPVGRLAHRFGALGTLRLLHAWRAVWLTALGFSHSLTTFTLCVAMLSVAEVPTTPMTQLVVSAIAGGADRVRTLAVMRTTINAGVSLGALAAAPLLVADSTWAFRSLLLVNAAAFLFAALLLGLLDVETGVPVAKRPMWRGDASPVWRDRRYLALTVINSVFYLHTVILTVGLPLWLLEATSAPPSLFSILMMLNTALAIALQVRFAKTVTGSRDGARALRNAGWALAALCPVLYTASLTGSGTAVALLVLATVLITAAELWQAAGGWELSYTHAPEASRPDYLSVFSLGSSGVGIVGPALVALLIGHRGWGLAALAITFVAASVAITITGRHLEKPEAENR